MDAANERGCDLAQVHPSLIIPTHNRVSLLERAVRSAIALDDLPSETEIIVVDNASTDGTARLFQQLRATAPGRLRYVREERLGLHHARHTGAKAARGDLLVFTDDDATFHPALLQAYARAFADHPEMAAAGGPVRPAWEVHPPRWLLDFIGEAREFTPLSIMAPWNEFRLDPDGWFYGVNLAIRRKHLFDLGGFNPESFGDVWLGDGETGLNRKLWGRGLLVGYVPDALVYHHIPAARLTVDYLRSRETKEGACYAYGRFHERIPSVPSLGCHAVGVACRAAAARLSAALVSRIKGQTDHSSLSLQLRAARYQGELRYVGRLIREDEFRRFVLRNNWLGPDPMYP
jgi:glucosyl-dolichyl phosphate glucuronosyltransferase